jgi:hypothetical protein
MARFNTLCTCHILRNVQLHSNKLSLQHAATISASMLFSLPILWLCVSMHVANFCSRAHKCILFSAFVALALKFFCSMHCIVKCLCHTCIESPWLHSITLCGARVFLCTTPLLGASSPMFFGFVFLFTLFIARSVPITPCSLGCVFSPSHRHSCLQVTPWLVLMAWENTKRKFPL